MRLKLIASTFLRCRFSAATLRDLVYGGPPCQGFSQIGPRDLRDPRNLLYRQFARILRTLKPKAFVMENVPNIVAIRNGHYKGIILDAFRDAGYKNTAVLLLVASDYGVPQKRRRIFFVGLREGLRVSDELALLFERHLGTNRSKNAVTVAEAISDLPRKVSVDDGPLPYPRARRRRSAYQRTMRVDCESPIISKEWKRAHIEGEPSLHNHHTKGIEAHRKRIIRHIGPGSCGDSIPSSLWDGVRPNKWRRLDPDQPSYTILAQMHRDLSEWIHPKHDRWITVREAARLQSFHVGFVFLGSERQQLKQVGNAVPTLLGFAVAGDRLLDPAINFGCLRSDIFC
jgi:DNA (cytosine-5)-methyltransferase 1